MGAFIAGSNTVSNMMFSLFQFSTAQGIGLDLLGVTVVVALQAIGGAAGNMICVHNVVAASATVGLTDREGDLIRKTLVPMTYYVVQGAFIGMALIYGGFWWLLAITVLFGWMALVGVVRAEFLRTRNFDYIRAAQALGMARRTLNDKISRYGIRT